MLWTPCVARSTILPVQQIPTETQLHPHDPPLHAVTDTDLVTATNGTKSGRHRDLACGVGNGDSSDYRTVTARTTSPSETLEASVITSEAPPHAKYPICFDPVNVLATKGFCGAAPR